MAHFRGRIEHSVRIVWTRPAMADLAALADFWEQLAPKKWVVILNTIVDKVGQIGTQPRLSQQDLLLAERRPAFNYRYVLADRYKVIYRVDENAQAVVINQVFDMRSNPDRLR